MYDLEIAAKTVVMTCRNCKGKFTWSLGKKFTWSTAIREAARYMEWQHRCEEEEAV